jgi:hypothetical protein
MTSGLGTPHNSPRRGDEVVEVLSLIQEEVGSATLVLIAVVTTQSVKLLEERCRQLLPGMVADYWLNDLCIFS